jgi:hypothetical protein
VRRRAIIGGCALALLAASGCARAREGAPLHVGSVAALPRAAVSRIVLVVMENAESSSVLGSPGAPYVNSLVSRYGLASRSYAITHPSLPNYLALTSGSTQGVESDCTDCHFAAPNLVDQLEAAGISWKAYLEGAPSACFRGAEADGYAKKHNPFIYYDDIAHSLARCHRLLGFDVLAADLRRGRLATFNWITPNMCDDGHDCSLRTADRFLARTLPPLIRELGPHGFLVLTWDEGTSHRGCCGGAAGGGRVLTVVVGPDVRRGSRYGSPVDHYAVLGTIEQALGLPPLGRAADPHSGRLTPLFTRPPRVTASAATSP